MSIITINPQTCNQDYICLKICPAGIITKGTAGYPEVKPEVAENCLECGHCLAVCPTAALALRGVKPEDCLPTLKEPLDIKLLTGIIKGRRSIRNYKKTPVPAEIINTLLELARWAPTGGNTQLVHWTFVEKPESMKEIIRLVAEWARGQEIFGFLAKAWDGGQDVILRGAPHLAIAHAGNGYGSTATDCAIAVNTLELAASAQGLGACWAGFFMIACSSGYKPLLDYLKIPEGEKIHAALMLGYPQFTYQRVPPRSPLQVNKI